MRKGQRHTEESRAKIAASSRCGKGHVATETNVYYSPDGFRRCKDCKRIRHSAFRSKMRAKYREVAAIMRCEGVQL